MIDEGTLDSWDWCRENLSSEVDWPEVAGDLIAEVRALQAEVERLNNKLNKDSQLFELECAKETERLLRAEVERLRGAMCEDCQHLWSDHRRMSGCELCVCSGWEGRT